MRKQNHHTHSFLRLLSGKETSQFNLLSLPLPFPLPVIHNMRIKRKNDPTEINNRFLNKRWGLFMANSSNSTQCRYFTLFGCSHVPAGYRGFLPLSFSLTHSPFLFFPYFLSFLFLGNILFCKCPDWRNSYNCSLVVQKECPKQTDLLKWTHCLLTLEGENGRAVGVWGWC